MTKEEYLKSKELIIKEYGEPEWDVGDPYNDSAKKLFELRNAYNTGLKEKEKNRRLANTVRAITENVAHKWIAVPEEVVRPEWLVPFNEKQQRIVKQWLKNIKQTPKQISDELNIPSEQVKNTMTLEAFYMLRRHLTNGCKELLPLESIIALRDVLASSNDATKLKAALTVLMDVGCIKANAVEAEAPRELVLDNETQEKLRKLGDKLI